VAVGSGDPDHLLTTDEGDHLLAQSLQELLTVEAAGAILRSVAALQRVLAPRAGRLDTAVPGQTGRHGADQSETDEPCDLRVGDEGYAHLVMISGRVVLY
jgi:hypothetical protein